MPMDHQGTLLHPHVLVFPLPLQGHVSPMLKLAELFCLAGLLATFIISDHAYDRLRRHTQLLCAFARYPGFCFKTISDGLADDHPRAGARISEMIISMKATGRSRLREVLRSIEREISAGSRKPVTCIVGDGLLGLAADVADEFGIPFIYFRTIASCCAWVNLCLPQIIETGELPLNGLSDREMNLPVRTVPGLESFLRRRDLPAYCRIEYESEALFQSIKSGSRPTTARGLILNTFEGLEGPILSQIRVQIPNLYAVGPLHAQLKIRLAADPTPVSPASVSFWEEDRGSIKWLDAQPSKSVLYASFGSITLLTRAKLMEIWFGLVNSGFRFLWVVRPESVTGDGEEGDNGVPEEILEGNGERYRVVAWAPQEEVLHHPAVGGFLTHGGWNSTLESVVAGVPMICWPNLGDQMINSRCVSELWKLGLDMKDTCDRVTVEKMVRDLMEERKDEFTQSADLMSELANRAVGEGGWSSCDLERLIEDIRFKML